MTLIRRIAQFMLSALAIAGVSWHSLAQAGTGLAKGTGELDEVWATEQNGNLNGGNNTGHGSIVVFNAIDMSVKTIIDTDGTDPRTCLTGQTPPNCVKITRPHTVQYSRDYKYAITIGTLSTSMSVFDAETKQLIQNFSVAPGTNPHTASATPDDARVFAVGIGGAKPFIQEYVRDFSNIPAPYSKTKFLDLTDVSTVAALADDPADAAKILGSTMPKPMNAVCPGYSIDSKDLYMRMSLGGLVIFDISKPKNGFYAISKVMDNTVFPINGCGFLLNDDADRLYLDSGVEHRSDIHVLDVSQETNPSSPRYGRVKNEVIQTIHTSGNGTTSAIGECQIRFALNCNDLHSMHFNDSGHELWAYSRNDSRVLVFDTKCQSGEVGDACLNVKDLFDLGPGFRSPDLSSLNRKDKLAYVSMRGPDPQPTAAHPIAGSGTPGIAVIDLSQRTLLNVFVLRQAAPPCSFTPGPTNGFECDDPHGVGYRFVPVPKHLSPTRLVGGM